MSECLKKAEITPLSDENGNELNPQQQQAGRCQVDFNPETLKYNLNSTTAAGRGKRPAQSVTQSASTLSMDLLFDTTTTGTDARIKTNKLVMMMDPTRNNGGSSSAGAADDNSSTSSSSTIVEFVWGTMRFEGYISSYMETMELFSAEGIPLRCSVSLSITQQERSFAPTDSTASGIDEQLNISSGAQSMRLGAGIGLSMGVSASINTSASMKGVAEFNGIENLRMPEVDSVLVVNGSGRGPAAFSAGTGAGFGAGAGINAGAGVSVGASAGASVGGSSTASAFAGLNAQASAGVGTPRASIGLSLSAPANSQIGLGSNSNFCPGGAATNQGSGSMSADVGINANISAGIKFEGGE